MPTKLSMEGLYKVFGPAPEEAVALARQGSGKDEIYQRTGSVVAVNDINLEVSAREIFVVMGLSGSGKSTLVRCINRLIEPTSGRLWIDGQDVLQLDAEGLRQLRLKKVAMVFQHFALFPHRTVAENAAYGLKVRGVAAAERRAKAQEALEAVGLGAWGEAYPANLSGGMQQRVGLARALAVDPEILLMDEPFSALDPLIRRDMQNELLALQERYAATIVFITHDLHEALTLGSRIAIMRDGAFMQVGTPEEIVSAPADDYVANFTKEVDRSRVLTLGRLARRDRPLLAPGEEVAAACRKLKAAGTQGLLVADEAQRPLGAVTAAALLGADPATRVEEIMERPAVTGTRETPLAAVLEAGVLGAPVALLDRQGRIEAAVDAGDLLAALGAARSATAGKQGEALHG